MKILIERALGGELSRSPGLRSVRMQKLRVVRANHRQRQQWQDVRMTVGRASLHDGEVDLDLVEPTRVHRGVDGNQLGDGARRRSMGFLPRCDEQLSMIQKTVRASLYGAWLMTY